VCIYRSQLERQLSLDRDADWGRESLRTGQITYANQF